MMLKLFPFKSTHSYVHLLQSIIISISIIIHQSGVYAQVVPLPIGVSITDRDIGRGYKVNTEQGESPFKKHVLHGSVEINSKTNSDLNVIQVKGKEGMKSLLRIDGALTVGLYKGLIKATATGGYYSNVVTTKKRTVIIYRNSYTAYFKKFQPGLLSLTSDAQNYADNFPPEDFAARFGTKYVSEVVYGAQLEVKYTVESSEDIDDQRIKADLTGTIGKGPLTANFGGIYFNMTSDDTTKFSSMDISVNARGASITVPADPSFEEVNDIINKFNAEYENRYKNCNNFKNDPNKLLGQLEPIHFVLRDTASMIQKLNELELDQMQSKLDESMDVFYQSFFRKAKLKQINEELRDQYESNPMLRARMYIPYYQQFEKVINALDEKIHECLDFSAKPFKEIASSSVPKEYPDTSTFDYQVFLGLQGDYCTLQHLPVTIGNYEPIQGVQYCGFGLQKDDGVEKKMIPWMSGKLLRSYSETEIAHADTPEKLYQQAAQVS